jgi:hypothetical protein
VGRTRLANLAIVGSALECERVRGLLTKASVERNFIGRVDSSLAVRQVAGGSGSQANGQYLGVIEKLDEIISLYHLDEIIFCFKDVTASQTIGWMEQLGCRIEYRTVPEGGETIIGSSSKDSAGELFTTTTRFQIASPMARRNKRLLDLFLAFVFLLVAPLLLFLVKKPGGFLQNLIQVILGKKSWVGYSSWQLAGLVPTPRDGGWQSGSVNAPLPKVKPSVLNPSHAFPTKQLDEATTQRLDFFYAKDYELRRDLEVVWKAWRELGQ